MSRRPRETSDTTRSSPSTAPLPHNLPDPLLPTTLPSNPSRLSSRHQHRHHDLHKHQSYLSRDSSPFASSTSLHTSLARLNIDRERDREQYVSLSARPESGFMPPGYLSKQSLRSLTPSATSISDADDDEPDLHSPLGWAGKGKAKANESSYADLTESRPSIAGDLPPEILFQIFRHLPRTRDLYAVVQVSKSWCLASFSLLWTKPIITSARQLACLTRVLMTPNSSFPYADLILRLNLSAIGRTLNDSLLVGLDRCKRVERLTIPNARDVSSEALVKLFEGLEDVPSIDLSMTQGVDDPVIATIAKRYSRLHGLNLTGCKSLTDSGLMMLAMQPRKLRRLVIAECIRITDRSIIPVTAACRVLIEIDLKLLPQITDTSLYAIFLNLTELRELRMSGNVDITGSGIPNLPALFEDPVKWRRLAPEVDGVPWHVRFDERPMVASFYSLRVVDFSGCTQLTDEAIENLTLSAPKIRNLNLAKCTNLSDSALESIGRLGYYLHSIHLGHISSVTDEGIEGLVKACTRIRYIDLACCPNLTDKTVVACAERLEKLTRIGLVKVTGLTDVGVKALCKWSKTLERVHLSYCTEVSVEAITELLNSAQRLVHLTLTGIEAFSSAELQQFCRPHPTNLSEFQRSMFCVYSGLGIAALRNYLNSLAPSQVSTSDEEGSAHGSSSLSSLAPSLSNHLQDDDPVPTWAGARGCSRLPEPGHRQFSQYRGGPGNVPPLAPETVHPGIPASVLASTVPNWLVPLVPPTAAGQGGVGAVDVDGERPRPRGPRIRGRVHEAGRGPLRWVQSTFGRER